jgi:hypothetical protein
MGQFKVVARKGWVKDPERYKTLICVNWAKASELGQGECPYGDKCQFAHGLHELRSRHDLHPSMLLKPGMPPLPPGSPPSPTLPPCSPPVPRPSPPPVPSGSAAPARDAEHPSGSAAPARDAEHPSGSAATEDEEDEALLRDIHRIREEHVLHEGFSYFSVLPM